MLTPDIWIHVVVGFSELSLHVPIENNMNLAFILTLLETALFDCRFTKFIQYFFVCLISGTSLVIIGMAGKPESIAFGTIFF